MKSLYDAMTKHEEGSDYKIIWKGKTPQKIKIFMWLMANNALLTKDNLIKRKWKGDSHCAFCDQAENINHLFFTCAVARAIWIVVAQYIGANNIRQSLEQCLA